jgi:hypothetical protein
MRHLSYVLCASIAACGFSAPGLATTNPPLVFTLDLLSPCTPGGCGTTTHATDIGLDILANSFSYAPGPSNSFVATMDVTSPVVCDEVASGGTLGATTPLRLSPTFTNSAPGGLLEFNGGGPNIVDLNGITFDGSTPSGVTASYSNYGATLPPQVVCYHISPISGGPVAYAAGPYGLFKNSFEDHPAGEPWLSVQTVFSPLVTAGKSMATSAAQPNEQINGVTPTNAMGYVVQIHNAAAAVGWHVQLGYDYTFFDSANNGGVPAQWCVLGAGVPQPGILSGSASCSPAGITHTLAAADIQVGSNSAYIYVENRGSAGIGTSWGSITDALYPAVAAVFPPFGKYPQRFDDKVAVASANNLPTLNIGSIVCNNDTTSTACVIRDQDGNTVPAALTFANTISGAGTMNIDPLAYFVDPTGGTTLPGNVAQDALTVSNVSCSDPSGILASPIAVGNFVTSPTAQGGKALGFTFGPNGSLHVPGTATCTATFTASGFAPALSSTGSFTITMLQPTVAHFAVSAPANATAGSPFSISVTAQDSANNTVASYSGTVHFSSTDGAATLPVNATLTNGVGTFNGTLKTAGSRTISATDTVTASITGTSGAIALSPAAATHLSVNAPASVTAGVAFNISVTALDQFNNTATAYAGTVHFTSTDAVALLPGDQALTFGVGTPSVMLTTTGNQTVTATDTATSSIIGVSGAIAVSVP